MVTLQILVLSFLVRVRVSQLVSIFQKWKMLFLFVSLVCRRGIETLPLFLVGILKLLPFVFRSVFLAVPFRVCYVLVKHE